LASRGIDRHGSQTVRPAKGHTEIYRGSGYTVDFLPKVKVEVAMADDMVRKAVSVVVAAAKRLNHVASFLVNAGQSIVSAALLAKNYNVEATPHH
jgi:nitrogen regulatory protein PII